MVTLSAALEADLTSCLVAGCLMGSLVGDHLSGWLRIGHKDPLESKTNPKIQWLDAVQAAEALPASSQTGD